jgi:hypothetical protein
MTTRVATANVLMTLPRDAGAAALDQVLAEQPDLVALQEWYLPRLGVLRQHGTVRLDPGFGLPAVPAPGSGPYAWVSTITDGNVVGWRTERYDLVEARTFLNVGPAPSERPDRFLRTEPPRFVATAVLRDREVGGTVALLSYHLSAGVQQGGGYRADRPRLAERHRHEVRHLELEVARLQAAGHQVVAAGDSNFDGLRLAGLTSAWEGRENDPGTHGDRKIDDVLAPGPATGVQRIVTASDHVAIVVTRPDPDAVPR